MTRFSGLQHVKWNPSRADLRRSALTMLVGFFVIGLFPVWRQNSLGASTYVLWGVGAGIALAALLPGLGRPTYLLVYVVSGVIGHGISQVLLSAIFVLLFLPLGLALRALGKDLLLLERRARRSTWTIRPTLGDADSYYHRF